MKLGKKVLSCLLALIMIMSSVSASFSVFAAGTALNGLNHILDQHYDYLMNAIDSDDDRNYPTKGDGMGSWVIEKDTYANSWFQLTQAYADVAKDYIGAKKSYLEMNEDIITKVQALAQDEKDAGIAKILAYYSFVSDDSETTVNVTMTIDTSFDLLAWDTIDDIEPVKEYFKGELKFGYKTTYADNVPTSDITSVDFTKADISDPFLEGDSSTAEFKKLLNDTMAKAVSWKALDPEKLSPEEVKALATGSESVSAILNKFDLFVGLTSATPEEVWNHYINTAAIDWPYAEVLKWKDSGIQSLIDGVHANSFQEYLNPFIDQADTYKTQGSAHALEFYTDLDAVFTQMQDESGYTLDGIRDKIAPEFAAYGEVPAGVKYWDYVVALRTEAKRTVAVLYTKDNAVPLAKLLATELPSFDHSDPDAQEEWEDIYGGTGGIAETFIIDATNMIETIDSYILPYCESKNVTDKFLEIGDVFQNDSEGTACRITEKNYNELKSFLSRVIVDFKGGTEFAHKAKLDAYMSTWRIPGQHLETFLEYLTLFSEQYNTAVALKSDPAQLELFNTVYPDGIDKYTLFYQNIVTAFYDRIDFQTSNVKKYYGEGSNSITFYNFEAIIDAYEACEARTAGYMNATQVQVSTLQANSVYTTAEEVAVLQARYDKAVADLTTIAAYYNDAKNYKSGLESAMAIINNGTGRVDTAMLDRLFGSLNLYDEDFETIVGHLNLNDILAFIDEHNIKKTNGVDLDSSNISSAMSGIIEDLDTLIVSEDMGKVLGAFLPTTDEVGNPTKGLGTWKYPYTETDGTVHKADDEVKNIKEYLINMVISFLYSGSLPTMIMQFLYPALAGAVNTQAHIDILASTLKPEHGLTDIISLLIPSLPHHFTWSKTRENHELMWGEFFGKNPMSGHSVDNPGYSEISADLEYATNNDYTEYDCIDGTLNYKTRITSWDNVAFEDWVPGNYWGITNEDTFYKALAASLSGVLGPLEALLQGNTKNMAAKVSGFTIKADLSTNAGPLYDLLLVPLYRLIGIEEKEIPSQGEMKTALEIKANGAIYNDYNQMPSRNGYDMLKVMLEPIFTWLYNDLFANPIETILELLPNLITAIEYNQLWPKISSLVVNIKVKLDLVIAEPTVASIPLDIGGIVKPLLEGMGLVLDQGITGLLPGLLGATMTTAPPTDDVATNSTKALTTAEKNIAIMDETTGLQKQKENPETGELANIYTDVVTGDEVFDATQPAVYAPIHVGDRSDPDGSAYYATNVGLITQTLYGVFGDSYFEWLFLEKFEKTDTPNLSGVKSDKSNFPLQIPVNRLIACGKVTSLFITRFKQISNHHINADGAAVVLTLFRWLFNDGGLDSIIPLIAPLLETTQLDENGNEIEPDPDAPQEESILDMIARIVDSQADTLMAIFVTLLNKYESDFVDYVDSVEENKFNYKDENGDLQNYLGSGNTTKFTLGDILEETMADYTSEIAGNDKADDAVKNLDQVLLSLIPTVISLIEPLIGSIGLSLVTKDENGDNLPLRDIIIESFITDDMVDFLFKLLFGTKEETTDADGNVTVDNGLLGGLLGSGVLPTILGIVAEFEIDLTPAGYFSASTTANGAGYNTSISKWLKSEAIAYDKKVADAAGTYTTIDSTSSNAEIQEYLETLTWAEIGVGSIINDDSFQWFEDDIEGDEYFDARFDNFIELFCDFLAPLNPIFSLILTGEDITFFDTITIRGNEGYSKGLVPFFDALGLTVDFFTVDNKTDTQDEFNQYLFGAGETDPNDKTTRFKPTVNSPLKAILTALKIFINGSEANGYQDGIIASPIYNIAKAIPNLAYFMFQYDTGEDDELGNDIKSSAFITAVENLIAPVLKLLDIVDPVLSRAIDFDIRALLDQYLDLETLFNTIISQALDQDWASLTPEEKENFKENYVSLDILDFGKIAADSSSSVDVNAYTARHSEDGDTTFTKFNGDPGQVLITLMREIMSPQFVQMLAELVQELFLAVGATTQEEADSQANIIRIIRGIVERINNYNVAEGQGIDVITGIFIDLLTTYDINSSEPYFYQIMNKFEDPETWDALEGYGIEHQGFDWDSEAAQDAELSKEKVEESIEGFDNVLNQAIPDVLAILTSQGIIKLPDGLNLAQGDNLWELAEGLLKDYVLKDDSINLVVNLLVKTLATIGSADLIIDIIKSAGFDITPAKFLYNVDDNGDVNKNDPKEGYDYLTYGFDSVTMDAEGVVTATKDGVNVPFDWSTIYENHIVNVYDYDEDGLLLFNEDGTPKRLTEKVKDEITGVETDKTYTTTDADGNVTTHKVYVLDVLATQYKQEVKDGKYVYTYKDAKGAEVEYLSEYNMLKAAKLDDGTIVTLTAKASETALWNWGIDALADGEFVTLKDKLIDVVWEMLSPFSTLFGMLFAGEDLKLFGDGLNIAGNNGYENVALPIMRAFGMDQVLESIHNDGLDVDDRFPDDILTAEEYKALIYADGKFTENGMGDALKVLINYVFTFVELVATYPITSIAAALPTLAYFLTGDGLTTLLTNLLSPVTTITDRLKEIIALDINGMGAGLLDMLATGSWSTFQAALQQYYEIDENGDLVFVEGLEEISLTNSIFELITGFTFDLSSIVSSTDPEDDGMYSIVVFLDKEAEAKAKAALKVGTEESIAEATAIRAGALRDFFKSIAALGDPIGANSHGINENMVNITAEGQVKTSKAEVLMFLVNFIFTNETLKGIVGDLLGYDVSDDNSEYDDVELLDEIITNVFNNPEALVGLITDLFAGYTVKGNESVKLIEIRREDHYEFYEDIGLETETEGESIISRIKTSVALGRLDEVIATVLDALKPMLLTEGSIFDGLGIEDEEHFTLEVAVNALLTKYAANDDMLNSLAGMIASALGSDTVSMIVDIVVDVLESSDYDLSPQAFATRVDENGDTVDTALAGFIGDIETWSEIATANTKYVYTTADGEEVYAATAGETTVDGVAVTPVYVTDENGDATSEQKTTVKVTADWGITGLEGQEMRDKLIDIVWDIVEPIAPILELLLTAKPLTLYGEISIQGMEGYDGVILPLFNAFAASEYSETFKQYDTYEKYYQAVYGSSTGVAEVGAPSKVLLTAITDVLFDFVDALCTNPITTITTILPTLARYLESDAVDTMMVNILSPVTTLLNKVSKIYSIDLVGMIKELLNGLMDSSNAAHDAETTGTAIAEQTGPMAQAAAYIYETIENAEAQPNDAMSQIANGIVSDEAPAESRVAPEITVMDILWNIIDGVVINGTPLSDIIPNTLFKDLAACIWKKGSMSAVVVSTGTGDETSYNIDNVLVEDVDYKIDKETVLLRLLDWVLFNEATRDLIGGLIKMNVSLEGISKDDPNYLVCALIYSVFDAPENIERIVIELLSFYEIDYKPASVRTDYSDLDYADIDYNAANVDKTQLDNLPTQIDGLIAAIVPVVSNLIPEGALGNLTLEGANIYEILGNLATGLLTDKTDADGNVTKGYLTIGVEALIKLIGSTDIIGQVLGIVGDVTEVDLELSSFKKHSEALNTYFADVDTWAEAYAKYAVTENVTDAEGNVTEVTNVVLTDANSFGVENLDDILELLSDVLAPFEQLFSLLLMEDNLVILDGIEFTAGDGYDRFLIPIFEVLGVDGIKTKVELKKEMDEAPGALMSTIVDYVEAFLKEFSAAPITKLLEIVPQLLFYVYSDGLAQGLEQFLAPILTLLDKIVAIVSREFEVDGVNHQAFDVYGLITDFINEKVITPVGLEEVENIYDVVDRFTTVEGIETLIIKWIDKTEETKNITINLGFEVKGMFKMLIEKSGVVKEVETAREFGARASANKHYVMGYDSDISNMLMGVIGDTILGGDMVKNLLNTLNVKTEGTIDTILGALTGENRYAIFQILLAYFNNYDVETMVLENLSFEKIEYAYDSYFYGNNDALSQRNVRRAIKKFDQSLLSAIPDVLGMFEENATVAAILKAIGGYSGQSLKDLVDDLLEHYAFNDKAMDSVVELISGLLSDAGIESILPILDDTLSIDLTPAGVKADASGALNGFIAAAAKSAGVNVEDLTWAQVNAYTAANDYDWGISSATDFAGKQDAFAAIFADMFNAVSPIVDFLLGGEDIKLLSVDGKVDVITLKSGEGYETAVYELFRALSIDTFAAAQGVTIDAEYTDAKQIVNTIIDAVFVFVNQLLTAPVETLLTVIPSLSYFLASDGVEALLRNVLAPVLALVDVLAPVANPLLNDIVRPLLEDLIGEYVAIPNTGNLINDLVGIAGDDGSNLIKIVNGLVSTLLIKDENGNEAEIGILAEDFFTSYVEHTITIEPSHAGSKWYHEVENSDELVSGDDYDSSIHGAIKDSKYVVEKYTVDPADSLIYLLNSVLSEDLLTMIADLLKVDLTKENDILAGILNKLIDSDNDGFIIADIIVKVFEGYHVEIAEFNGAYVKDDAGYQFATDDLKDKMEVVPGKLDTVINKALPIVLPLIKDLIPTDGIVGDLLGNFIPDTIAGFEDGTIDDLAGVVDQLLNGQIFSDDIVNLILGLVPSLLGSDIVDTILSVVGVTGISLSPQGYLSEINAQYKGKTNATVTAMNTLIGDSKTWADVAANATDVNFDLGITDAGTFAQSLGVILAPLYPVFAMILQGKGLSLFDYSADEYISVTVPEDALDGYVDGKDRISADAPVEYSGNGYVVIRGAEAYEQALIPLLETLGLTAADGLLSQADFNALDTSEDILVYVFDMITALLGKLVDDGLVTYLSTHLASIIYFLASDGVASLVDSALASINAVLGLVDPLYKPNAINLDLSILKIENLLGLVNDLTKSIGLVITQKLLLDIAASMGDVTIVETLRKDAKGYMVDANGNYYDVDGNLVADSAVVADNKVATIVGDQAQFITGILDEVLTEEVLGSIQENLTVSDVVDGILTNLKSDAAIDTIVNVVVKVFNAYINEYKLVGHVDLTKIVVDYNELGVSKDETTNAINTIDSLVGTVLGFLGMGSLEDLLNENVYTDNIASMLMGALLNALAGLDEKTWTMIEDILGYASQALGMEIEFSPAYYAQGDGKLAELFEGTTTWKEAADKVDGFDFGISSAATADEKAAALVSVIVDLASPFNSIIAVLLDGGVYDVENNPDEKADAIGLLGEINISGGSGYNYAIIPILEAFGIEAITQAEYSERIANGESPLQYILESILTHINHNLDTPINFVLSILSNLFKFISNDGLTTVVNNLIAPISQYIKEIEGIVPLSVTLDLRAIVNGGSPIAFFLGDDVAANNANVGVNIDLNDETLEGLIADLLAKYVPALSINLDFSVLAGKTAKADADHNIIYTDSKVDPLWDTSVGTNGKNITGEAADTLIVLLQEIITTENINAILEMLKVDLSGLDPTIKSIIDQAIANPEGLIAAIIKILNMSFDIETAGMVFKYLFEKDYNYSGDRTSNANVTTAINKIDGIIVNNLPKIIEALATGSAGINIEIINEIYAALGDNVTITNVVNYFLTDLAFKDEIIDTVIGLLVNLLGGLDTGLLGTITSVAKELVGIDLNPAAFADVAGGKLEDFILSATASDAEVGLTWADVANAYKDADGKVVVDYDWNVTDRDSFMEIFYSLLTPLAPALDYVLVDESVGYELYTNVIVTIGKALGIDLPKVNGSVEAVKAVVDGIFGLVDEVSAKPITTIIETVSTLAYFIANNGVGVIVDNVLSPVDDILDIVNGFLDNGEGFNLDSILKDLIGISISEIRNIAGPTGENLVAMINNLINGINVTEGDQTVDALNTLPSNFFYELSQYAIDVAAYDSMEDVGKTVDSFTVDKADGLMYVLQTVFTENTLDIICKVIGLDTSAGVGQIVTGLAGKQDEIVDIILMLLTEYDVTYEKITQKDIIKIPVEGEDVSGVISTLDSLVNTVLGFFNIGSIDSLLNGLVADAGLGNMIAELLVPVLAGLDIDSILDIVAELTSIKVDINPQAFVNGTAGSKLADYIGTATSWQAVLDAHAVKGADGKYTFDNYDFEIDNIEDLINFVSDLAAPLDFVFKIILAGDQIVVLEDESGNKNDIRINGGYGYNYAILPLLEAFGIDALSQADYEARVEKDGSSIKYILEEVLALVEAVSANPVQELISRLANIFYFIGSDGINTVVSNLVAPINTLIDEVNDVYPIAINIDIGQLGKPDGNIIGLYFGQTPPPGVPAGITVSLSGNYINKTVNELLEGIVVNGEALGLTIDLDWNKLAAMMAKEEKPGDPNGYLVKNPSKQVYDLGMIEDAGIRNFYNIEGDVADTVNTIVQAIFTPENSESIAKLVSGLIPDTLDPAIKETIFDILSKPDSIQNLISAIIVVLSGQYDLKIYDMVYKYLGVENLNDDELLEGSIAKLDTVIKNAIPVVLEFLVTDDTTGILADIAKLVEENPDDYYAVVEGLLNDLAFNDEMMETITSLVINAIGGFLSTDITDAVDQLLGIDLSPVGYANASGNAQIKAFIGTSATWADVVTNNTVDGKLNAVFSGIDGKDAFIDAILAMLTPLNDVLGYILCGNTLDFSFNGNKLIGNDAYNNVVKYLHTALGIDELGVKFVTLTDNANATAAIRATVDYIFAVVEKLCEAPIGTIITVVGNLSYFIANDGVEVVIRNLAAPVLSLLDVFKNVISMDQIDALIGGFLPGWSLTKIIKIADNGGAELVKMINELLVPESDDDTPVYIAKALPEDFFIELSKAAIRPDGTFAIGDEVDNWVVDKSDALLYVLTTVLSRDFLDSLCGMLKMDTTTGVGDIIVSLAGKAVNVEDIVVALLNEYAVGYETYNQVQIEKIKNAYTDNAEDSAQIDEAITIIDGLIPMILGLVGMDADNLQDVVYPLFVKDDLANTLVSTIVNLLAGLPAETIDMVLEIVNEQITLKGGDALNIDIAPQAFTADKFGSKLGDYIGSATTWAEVAAAHDGTAFAFGITEPADFVNLVCDFLAPLNIVFEILFSGGTIEALEEIHIVGGKGYNYGIIPLLEALGIDPISAAEFETKMKAGDGVHYVLDAVFTRVDEILTNPVSEVLEMLANLAYILGNGSVETFVANILAPINQLIDLVDPIFPIAIALNIDALLNGGSVVETYLGKNHPGVDAGITLSFDTANLNNFVNDLLAGIMVNGKPLGISIDLDFLKIAASAAAVDENGDIKFADGKLDYSNTDEYAGGVYKNVVGSRTEALITLLKLIVTQENVDALLALLGKEDGLGDPFDELIDSIIKNPEGIIAIIIGILNGLDVSYVPIQNREIYPVKFDYSGYLMLTEANADIIANDLDGLINSILGKAGLGSVQELVSGLFVKESIVNDLVGTVYNLFAGSTVDGILSTIKGLTGLDYTAYGYYSAMKEYPDQSAIGELVAVFDSVGMTEDTTWAQVAEKLTGTLDFGFEDGDIKGFAKALADVFSPFASLLELFLVGEGKSISIKEFEIPGCNGYDYAIIPILEAFGFPASELMTAEEYATAYAADQSVLLGEIIGKIAEFLESVLANPVDVLTSILPNVAYFISNEGVYLALRNLIAPLFGIVEAAEEIFDIKIADLLNISTLLHNINIPIQIMGATYGFKIPEIDFLKLATYGGDFTKEVNTARSNAANSYVIPTDPFVVREDTPNKNSQTFVHADKGDTLTLVLTWLLEMFAEESNREALVQFLVEMFELESGAEETLRYGINRLFIATNKYDVPDLIVGSLFEALGLAVKVDAALRGDLNKLQEIYELILEAIASNKSNPYAAIAQIMEEITGVWNDTIGSEDDYNDAVDSAGESLNAFQRFFRAIANFFRRLFGMEELPM